MSEFPSEKDQQQQNPGPGFASSTCILIAGALIFFFPKFTGMPDKLAAIAWAMYVIGLIAAVIGIVCMGTALDQEWRERHREYKPPTLMK